MDGLTAIARALNQWRQPAQDDDRERLRQMMASEPIRKMGRGFGDAVKKQSFQERYNQGPAWVKTAVDRAREAGISEDEIINQTNRRVNAQNAAERANERRREKQKRQESVKVKGENDATGIGGFALDMMPFGRIAEDLAYGRAGEISGKDFAVEGALTAIPFGIGKGVKAVRGAKAGAKALSKVDNVDDLLKVADDTGDLVKRAKKTAGKNVSKRTGNRMYRSALGIDNITTSSKTKPYTLFKADDLVKEAQDIGLRGSPGTMLRQVNQRYAELNPMVNKALSLSDETVDMSKLFDEAVENVSKQLPQKIDNVSVENELLRSLIQLDELAEGGKLSATAVKKFKDGLNVDNAFRKVQGELGSNLTSKEAVDLALWKQADDWMAKLAPEAKGLTRKQSRLYGLSQGLSGKVQQAGRSNELVGLARSMVSPMQSRMGRNFSNFGDFQSKMGQLPGVKGVTSYGVGRGSNAPLSPLKEGLLQGGIRLPTTQDSPETNSIEQMFAQSEENPEQLIQNATGGVDFSQQMFGQEQPEQQDLTGQDFYSGFGIEQPQQTLGAGGQFGQQQGQTLDYSSQELFNAALQAMSAGDEESAAGLMDFAEMAAEFEQQAFDQQPELGGGGEADGKMQTAKTIVDNLMNVYTDVGGPQGAYSGRASNLLGALNVGESNEQARAYEQNRMSYLTPIIKAFGEVGVLTDKDREVVAEAIPSINDTPAQAQQKINLLYQMLESLSMSNQQSSDPFDELRTMFEQQQQYAY